MVRCSFSSLSLARFASVYIDYRLSSQLKGTLVEALRPYFRGKIRLFDNASRGSGLVVSRIGKL